MAPEQGTLRLTDWCEPFRNGALNSLSAADCCHLPAFIPGVAVRAGRLQGEGEPQTSLDLLHLQAIKDAEAFAQIALIQRHHLTHVND